MHLAGCSSPPASCFKQTDSLPTNVSIEQHGYSFFCNPAAVSSSQSDSLKPWKNHADGHKPDPQPTTSTALPEHHCEKLTLGWGSDHLRDDRSLGRLQHCLLIPFFWVLLCLLPMPELADLSTCRTIPQIQVASPLAQCHATFVRLLENLQHRDPWLGIPAASGYK